MAKYVLRRVKNVGKPYAGKPHVRFDEEGLAKPVLHSTICSKVPAKGDLNCIFYIYFCPNPEKQGFPGKIDVFHTLEVAIFGGNKPIKCILCTSDA